MKFIRPLVLCYLSCVPVLAAAGVDKNLPLPKDTPDAKELAEQVYFANHFYAFRNFSIGRRSGQEMAVLINRDSGGKITRTGVERHLNNGYANEAVKARDLSIFRSGNLRGSGMLVTEYSDDAKSNDYVMWIPALRKVRRFAQPDYKELWGGSVFTFGDVTLRKPMHETHELLGTATFEDCLGAVKLEESDKNKYMQDLPTAACEHKGKKVYKLKSTTKFKNWWYDYRISYVDTKTFADYRTEYFKNDKKIKVIDRDWGTLGLDDPRALKWNYWYGTTLATGHETWAVIPPSVVRFNEDLDPDLWSESTLRKIKR